MSRLDKGPTANPNIPVASEGILSPEKQAELVAHQDAVIAGIRAIKDPTQRWKASLAMATAVAGVVLDMASAIPGASIYVTAIQQGLDRLGKLTIPKGETDS